jgi:hypothetical protein
MHNGSTILLCVTIFVVHKQCLIRAHCSIVTVLSITQLKCWNANSNCLAQLHCVGHFVYNNCPIYQLAPKSAGIKISVFLKYLRMQFCWTELLDRNASSIPGPYYNYWSIFDPTVKYNFIQHYQFSNIFFLAWPRKNMIKLNLVPLYC